MRSVKLLGRFSKIEQATSVNNVAVTVVSWVRHAWRKRVVVILEIERDWNLEIIGNVIFSPLHRAVGRVAVDDGGMGRG